MSRICLDTSAYTHFRRNEPAVTALLDDANWIGISAVVVGELWAGFLDGTRLEWNIGALQDFLANPIVERVSVDEHIAHLYGEIFVALKRAGSPVPTNDIWIAACAARHGATVLTFDSHFQAIQRVGSIVLEAP